MDTNYHLNLNRERIICKRLKITFTLTLAQFKGTAVGKSVGLCKTTKIKDQLYISFIVSVWTIICENVYPNGLILSFSPVTISFKVFAIFGFL